MATDPSCLTNAADEYAAVLVSPREPSGVSWIINCLLELGIRVDLQPTVEQIFGAGRAPASAMWLPADDGRWRLHPRASALQKWLPILSRQETFTFRPAPRIWHVQQLPRRADPQRPVLLFVRDLRDALHSLYRRQRPQLAWPEFVAWPQAETLLDAIDHWRLFLECWLAQPQVFVGRFEDYKTDAPALLGRVVEALQLSFSADELAGAAERSSYAAAAAAEARYREAHPRDQQVVNRAGLVGEWQRLPELQSTVAEIARRAGRLLTRLGYAVDAADASAETWDAVAVTRGLSSYAAYQIPDRIVAAAPPTPTAADRRRLERFVQELSVEKLSRAQWEADEIRTLLRHLVEFCRGCAPALTPQVEALAQAFAAGSPFHLARIRELLVSRRSDSTP